MSKVVKSLMMKDLSDQLQGVSEAVFVDISKLDGVSNNRLRVASQKDSVSLLGTRLSLARRVLIGLGWNLGEGQVAGATTIAWGADCVRLSRMALKWEKEFPGVVVKGGYVDGQVVTADEVKVLSESPSKEELIGRIVGSLLQTCTAALSAINSQGSALASQAKQLSEREQS